MSQPLAQLISDLVSYRADGVFNPYGQRCTKHDLENAPLSRAKVLEKILAEASQRPGGDIWVGRDLGHRGGRRTGLALTDDAHYTNHLERWGVEAELPVSGPLIHEVTASIIWAELAHIRDRVFLWNVFPFHPHDLDIFSNRAHTAAERDIGLKFLDTIIGLTAPKRIVSIGNDADHAVRKLKFSGEHFVLRHPSFGGANIFRRQVRALYGLPDSQPSLF